MKQYDLEKSVISCILQREELMNELYVSDDVFANPLNRRMLVFFKKFYEHYKHLDISIMVDYLKDDQKKSVLIDYYVDVIDYEIVPSHFYDYQERLIEQYKNNKIIKQIELFQKGKMETDQLLDEINNIQNEIVVAHQKNKVTPDEMIRIVRSPESTIEFDRFDSLNEKLEIKKKTLNVIGARPSEGKSALALNLFCDLAKKYKCVYFNMEMTEKEVYERMLGMESDIPIKNVKVPKTEQQDSIVKETANRIYSYKYEVINGSKTVNSIKAKIIKEQRDEHLIVFIDYVGYIVGKAGESDKDRIGNAVRELNNITKDYDCTIFLIAQINRGGAEQPTMQDLKDSGELEQTADTIILIHDENKEDNKDIKEISFLIPKCRGGKRNIRIPVTYDKTKQKMEVN